MKAAETMTRIVCDGCGRETQTPNTAGWVTLQLAVLPLSDGDRRDREVDLCPRCLAAVSVPGIE